MLEYYDAITTLADVPDLHGDATALIFDGRMISYHDLAMAANQAANGLIDLGLAAGTRVAFLGFDSERSYELLFGCARAGLVLVSINWRLEAEQINYILQDCQAEALFVGAETLGLIEAFLPACSRLRAVFVMSGSAGEYIAYEPWRTGQEPTRPNRPVAPSDPAVQVYTSGTSGRPKGVVLAHHCFIDLVREIERAGDELVAWKPGDTSLLALPTFHIGGQWWAVQGLINGVRNVVLKTFNAALAIEAIEKYRVSKLAFVPAMVRFILSEPASQEADLTSVESLLYGGSPMPFPILERAIALFKCRFVQNYGLSETCNMGVFLPSAEFADLANPRLKAAGKPLRGIEARILDEHGTPLPAGETGEIAFKTPAHMLEYWQLPEATAKTLVDGWLHTGDAGHMDQDGFVYVTDRIKDLIISAGENIYPAEIERVLMEHPDIDDVAVVGIPDDRWGEVPIACVVKRAGSGLTRPDVLRYARDRIASFKLPRNVEFIDQLPRNASGKILKRVLREPYWAGREKRVN